MMPDSHCTWWDQVQQGHLAHTALSEPKTRIVQQITTFPFPKTTSTKKNLRQILTNGRTCVGWPAKTNIHQLWLDLDDVCVDSRACCYCYAWWYGFLLLLFLMVWLVVAFVDADDEYDDDIQWSNQIVLNRFPKSTRCSILSNRWKPRLN